MRPVRFIFVAIPILLTGGIFTALAMTPAALNQQMASGSRITVIDIRGAPAFAEEHIPGAINVPATVCPLKSLPRLGAVVVCGDGLGDDSATGTAAQALARKPGLTVDVLEGGFAAWKGSQRMTTRGAGFKRETLNYTSYARVKALKADGVVLYDLRKAPAVGSKALTDLQREFPGARLARSREELTPTRSSRPPLIVLIDNGDGTSEQEARLLKASGQHSYAILAGGELIIERHGEAGLQRRAPISARIPNQGAANGASH